jgi:hypothetical protein
MTLDDARNWATIAAAAVAATGLVTGLWKGAIEYSRQNAEKRAEFFIEMRKRLKDNPTFQKLCSMIEADPPELANEPIRERCDLLGFYEEVALMVRSGVIHREVAHYMFGFMVIKCWDSKHFWQDIDRGAAFWTLFRSLVCQMKDMDRNERKLGKYELDGSEVESFEYVAKMRI